MPSPTRRRKSSEFPGYADQLARAKQRRAEAAALRPPRPPAIGKDPAYRAAAERRRYWRTRYGIEPPPQMPPRPREPRPPLPPLIDVPSGHSLYEEARASLHRGEQAELGGSMDATARDLMGEYVLAVLDGRDPDAAVRAFRTRHNRDRKWLVHGTHVVDDLWR